MDTVTLHIGARVIRDDSVDYSKVDVMRDAMLPVLQRHGYDIPGVADLCAIAALRAANSYDGRVLGIEISVDG